LFSVCFISLLYAALKERPRLYGGAACGGENVDEIKLPMGQGYGYIHNSIWKAVNTMDVGTPKRVPGK